MPQVPEELSKLTAQAKARPSGDREAVLSQEVRKVLDGFVEALRKDGKTEATSRSYRSYMVTALLLQRDGKGWDEFSSDVRSAVRAFERLMK